MATRKFVMEALVVLSLAYPRNGELPDATTDLYCKQLADVPDELLNLSVSQIISTSKWFPTIAELREAAAQLQLGTSEQLTADEAWGDCLKTMRRLGYWEKPEFSTDLISKCVEAIGGWRYLQMSEELMTDRSHFVKAYEQLSRREAVQAQLPSQLRACNNPALQEMRGLSKLLSGKKD